MKPELFCHEDNVHEFNAALREHPSLRAFAAALHQAREYRKSVAMAHEVQP